MIAAAVAVTIAVYVLVVAVTCSTAGRVIAHGQRIIEHDTPESFQVRTPSAD